MEVPGPTVTDIRLPSTAQSGKGGGHSTDEKAEAPRGQLTCPSPTAHGGRVGTTGVGSECITWGPLDKKSDPAKVIPPLGTMVTP